MLAQSDNEGGSWSVQSSPQNSTITPDLIAVAGATGRLTPYYWSWIGTDPNHSINIMRGTSLTTWQSPLTYTDTSPYESVIGYVGQSNRLLLAWTGNDPQHHLNFATVPV